MAEQSESLACGIKAADNFRDGWYCSEAVFRALLQHMQMDQGPVAGVAAGFASGVARHGGMCGALSGAILAIGLQTGRQHAQDSMAPTYDLVSQMIRQFQNRFGTINCCELLNGCDLGTEEGRNRFRDERLHRKCVVYTQGAAELCASLLPKAP